MENLVLFEIIVFFGAGLAHGILGFGFPMVATPLLSIFLTLKESVLYTLFPTMIVNANVIKKSGNFREVWQEYWLLILFVLIGSFIGTNFLIVFYNDAYTLILASVILLYLNTGHMKFSLYESIQKNPKLLMISFGFFSGIVSGLVNIMIPVLIIYIIESKIPKEKSIIVMNFCFFISKAIQIVIFGIYGSFSSKFLLLMIPIVTISLIGLFLGLKIRAKLDENLYAKILRLSLWILSCYLIIKFFIK
ncbi:sulfite exporter TauE/SafE family protein [Sulfurospirillum arcachonense]|uniref:sulfite exporter TauE/SafE family protein n=1 Tax=Sulfurospirillum arcachonense TaxID=57666 RepID=UPI0004681737|nr:sulfite exporter TauE/SafE family protein [Sulfurospirillum arcachonense]